MMDGAMEPRRTRHAQQSLILYLHPGLAESRRVGHASASSMPSCRAFSPAHVAAFPARITCRFPRSIRMLSGTGCRWSEVMDGNKREADESENEEELMRSWWEFTKSPTAPTLVRKLFANLRDLEAEMGEEFVFGGMRGSLKGRAGVEEDNRHRAFYKTLADSEAKLQFFTARQIACRILGSRAYLCAQCWLPQGDCMCQEVAKGFLSHGVKLWLYMHPKDFLRKNNTGKLLWQVFGPTAARLCIFAVPEQEELMWDAFKQAGHDHVWCLYPEQSAVNSDSQAMKIPEGIAQTSKGDDKDALHFVLIDGTWSNSKAMVSRLQNQANSAWGGKCMPFVTLNPDSLSVMHGLRPQPSMDRTCTAAAAAHLLRELHLKQELAREGLEASAASVDHALAVLMEALASRRRRVGRPEVRVGRRLLQIRNKSILRN